MARRKVKNGEKSPWGQCLTRPVPNGRRSLLFFVPYIFFRPFRLSLAPFICPWVSEDASEAENNFARIYHPKASLQHGNSLNEGETFDMLFAALFIYLI